MKNNVKTEYLTLYELNTMVADAVSQSVNGEYWVETELSELKEVRGNCYMEMVQRGDDGNTPVARASAKCWRNTWLLIGPYFERITGQRLAAGIKVMIKVYAQFHPAYGFSWIVTDIDPVFTLGDMACRRREIINRLKEQGVLNLNKELPLPAFSQRIAVISAPNAAGYGDFCKQICDNAYSLRFSLTLFEAVMQGEATEKSIINALDSINAKRDEFDCVVIIRGGGAVSDLSGFDSLALAENVANFPLPVITGIGHERDDTVIDTVAHTRMKTPTAVAAFLIDNLKKVADRIEALKTDMAAKTELRMEREHRRIERLSADVKPFAVRRLMTERMRVEHLSDTLKRASDKCITAERHRMEILAQRIEANDPSLLLKRGYSITLHNGRAVYAADALNEGDVIETRLYKGTLTSAVIYNKVKKHTVKQ